MTRATAMTANHEAGHTPITWRTLSLFTLLAVSACAPRESPTAPQDLPATLTLGAGETRTVAAADLALTFVEGPSQCAPEANCSPGRGQQGLFMARIREGEAGFLLSTETARLRTQVVDGVTFTLLSLEARPRLATLRIERALPFDSTLAAQVR